MKSFLFSPILFILMACGIQTQDSPLPDGAIARLGFHRFQHLDTIKDVMFTPDGSAVLAHNDHDAILWDLATGTRRQSYARGSAGSGVMSRDGRRSVLTDNSPLVHVYDVPTGKKIFEASDGELNHCAAINGDGSVIATASTEVILWDVASGIKLKSWNLSQGFPVFLRFSQDGRFLALGRTNLGAMTIYPGTGNGEPVNLDGGTGFMPWLEFSPTGDQIAGTCEREIAKGTHESSLRVWDPTTGQLKWSVNGSFNACRFSPDGRLLAAGELGNVVIFDAASGRELHRLPKTNGHIRAVAFSPDGKVLATAHGKRIRLWETDGWQEIDPGNGHNEPTNAVAFAPDGRTIATGGLDRSVILWTWPEGIERHRMDDIGTHWGVTHLTFAPDSRKIAAQAWINGGDPFFVFDAASGALLSRFGKERQGFACEFLPGSRDLLTAGVEGDLNIWEAASGRHLRTIGTLKEGRIEAIRSLGDSQNVWWAGEYQQLGMRDLKSGRDVRFLKGGVHHANCKLELSPDGDWLAVGSRVWELNSGEVIAEGGETPSAISPDGHLLAFVGGEGITVWEQRTRKVIHSFGSGAGELHQLAFSPDGTVLVAAGDSDSLVWDMTGLLTTDRRRLPQLILEPNEMDAAWELLASDDGWKAQQAAWKLAAGGESAIEFLVEQVRPTSAPDAPMLRTFRDALRDKDYDKRELAARALVDLGVLLKPGEIQLLRRPATNFGAAGFDPNAPAVFDPPPVLLPLPVRMRQSRAIAALERSGLPMAASHLDALSHGDCAAPLTLEARSAVVRARQRMLSIPARD
ncbi:MAG: WD40 repeat domain-containing protein [Planctomycetota bacterium]|nr:WD40 repeat domain-containing protein [Planctomycetota bacterium]